jgi:integrase
MPKLTSASVERLRPGKERREIPDSGCPSLRLVIQTSGHKSWAMRFRRPSGRSAKLTLGPVDLSSAEQDGDPVIGMPLTLVAARRLAVDILRQRAMGRDVVADIAAAKHRRLTEDAKSAANTFSVAARDFIIEYAVKKTRSSKTTARMIGFDPKADFDIIPGSLADRWRDKPVTSIDGHDLYGVIDEVKRSGIPGWKRRKKGLSEPLARLMRSHLSTMFGWLVEHRRVASNPCASVHKPDGGKARDRVLSDAEIVKFWQAAETEKLAPMLKLLLLTGCRPREVLGMTRSEISDDGVWTIPSERSKNHLPHVVHLPPMAQQLIPAEGFGAYWASAIKVRLDEAMGIDDWQIRDLRRTFVTGLANLGIRPDVIELAVNHSSGTRGGVAGVYNRSKLLPERKAALERWAAHVIRLVEGRSASVVPMKRA